MRCCVSFCKNTEENDSRSGITFHEFPTEPPLRTAWLRALGKEDNNLPNSAVVCSQHFMDDDIYETGNGLKQICSDAVPSTVNVCLICLDADSKLLSISKHKLETAYENLTGSSLSDVGNLKQTLCIECAQRLIDFNRFREKSLRTRPLMEDLVGKHDLITIQHVKSINRVTNRLTSNIGSTTLEPNSCDLYIEVPDKDTLMVLDETERRDVDSTARKNDGNSITIGGVHTEIKLQIMNESENVLNDVNVDSVMQETELMNDAVRERLDLMIPSIEQDKVRDTREIIKLENTTFECKMCCDVFVNENTFKEHTMTHVKLETETDDLLCGTRESEPRSRNASWKSALAIEYQLGRTASGGTAASDGALVAPLMARHVTRNEKLARPTETADGSGKDEQLLEMDGDELNVPTDTNVSETICDDFKNAETSIPKRNKTLTRRRKVDIPCNSNSSGNDNLSKDCQKTKQTKPKKLYKDGSGIICLNSDMNKECNSTPANNSDPHTEAKQCPCDACQSADADDKPHICKVCQYKCKYYSILVTHMRTHTGERLYSCKLCDSKFSQQGSLARHMRTHSGVKPFSCKLCDFKCARMSYLAIHMKTHVCEKPVSCKFCDYKGARNADLIKHMKTHTGGKPFVCETCDYKCARSCDLVSHMRTHTGEKPFSCYLCDYKCALSCNLARHMRSHAREN